MTELVASDLIKRYNDHVVVGPVSLNVLSGSVVGLLGPNGAGKTTIFHMISGILKPDSGIVCLDGTDIAGYPTYLRALNGMGYLPQKPSVFAKITVKQNLMIVLESMPLSASDREARVFKFLDELGILKLANERAALLSGGERRRLEIARALLTNPKIMLLDEPFAGVDPIAVKEISGIIALLKNKGIGILISDHNVRETLMVCDVVFVLNEGKIIKSGSPDMIIRNPAIRKFYLGEEFKL